MKTLAVRRVLLTFAGADARSDGGSIRGHLCDEQGAELPGVTVEATSPTVGGTCTAVTWFKGSVNNPVHSVESSLNRNRATGSACPLAYCLSALTAQ